MPIFTPEHFASLLQQARSGSPEILGRLLEPFRHFLLVTCQKLLATKLKGHVDNTELVQDTFQEAIRSFAEFRGSTEAELSVWLQRIIKSRAANLGRRHLHAKKRTLHRQVSLHQLPSDSAMGDQLIDSDATPYTSTSARERALIMEQALETLKREHQLVIALHHHGGKTFAEIATELGKSSGSIEKTWDRALKAWRAAMEEMGLKEW